MGLFSGSKKSSTTSNTTNQSTSLGIDGDLAGILGDGNTLLNDNSMTDIYTDNSDNSRLDWYQDNSDNSRVDIYQDLSDNRNLDGQLAGANVGGNVTINTMADGAFDFAVDVVRQLGATQETAMKNATEQTYLATQATLETAKEGFLFGNNALRSVENTASDAIKAVTDTSRLSGEQLGSLAEMFAQRNEQVTQSSIGAATEAMERNAALIQTTALGGQDLMLDTMKKVMMAVAAVMGLGMVYAMTKGRN